VLSVMLENEFAGDGDNGSEECQEQHVCAQKEAKRKTGDQRAAWIERWKFAYLSAGILNQQDGAEGHNELRPADVEFEPTDAINEQRGENRDLVMAWVTGQER